ncbi:MAG: hypothetical protein ABIH76_07910 [Candidatus Bathyarchaeota archaeon]
MANEKECGNRVIVTSYVNPESFYSDELQKLNLGYAGRASASKVIAVYKLLEKLGVPQADLEKKWGMTPDKIEVLDVYARDELTKAPESEQVPVVKKRPEYVTPEDLKMVNFVKNKPTDNPAGDDVATVAQRYLAKIDGGADECWLEVVNPKASRKEVDTDKVVASYMARNNLQFTIESVDEKVHQERQLGLLRKIYRDASKPAPKPKSWFSRLLGR